MVLVAPAERPHVLDGMRERPQHRAAPLAAREMAQNTALLAALELALEVIRHPLARLLARGHPRPKQRVHRPLDGSNAHSDSESYDAPMHVGAMQDAAVVAQAQAGDLDAFAELVRRYEHRVRAVLLRLLDDERDVEEATQDCFVQAWRNLDRYRGDAAVFTWLYRIAVNEAMARLRRRKLAVAPLEDALAREPPSVAATASAETEAEHQALGRFLSERIKALPFEYRAPLVLRDIVGLSNDEVAVALELSVPAAKSRIHRARMQLRDELEAWERASPERS